MREPPPREEELVRTLVDGPDDDARRGAQQAALGSDVDRTKLRSLLMGRIARYRQDKTWGIRAWLLSTLGRVAEGDSETITLLLAFLDPERESEAWVRYWVLEGLWAGGLSSWYFGAVDDGLLRADPDPLVARLAQAMRAFLRDPEALESLKSGLSEPDVQYEVLRALRQVPVRALRDDVEAAQRAATTKDVYWNARKALERMEMEPTSWEEWELDRLTRDGGTLRPGGGAGTPEQQGEAEEPRLAQARKRSAKPESRPAPERKRSAKTKARPTSGREKAPRRKGQRRKRVWLAAARPAEVDWRLRLKDTSPFLWGPVKGAKAQRTLAGCRPGDAVLLYDRGGSGDAGKDGAAVVGWAIVRSRTGNTIRLVPQGSFEPLPRKLLERAVPDLHVFKRQGVFTEVTAEQWSVLLEILRQRERFLGESLPLSTTPEAPVATLSVEAPPTAPAGGSLAGLALTVRNTGNVTWRTGEELRTDVAMHSEDGTGPVLGSGLSIRRKLSRDLIPGDELVIRTSVPELPSEAGRFRVRWILHPDRRHWPNIEELGRVEHSIEIVTESGRARRAKKTAQPAKGAPKRTAESARRKGSRAPDLTPTAAPADEADAPETASGEAAARLRLRHGKALARFGEKELARSGEEAQARTEKAKLPEPETPEPDVLEPESQEPEPPEPEHVPRRVLDALPPLDPPRAETVASREVTVVREAYAPPARDRKLTLRIGADAAVVLFGADEYKSPLRIDFATLLGLEDQPLEYGKALFEMVFREDPLPGSPARSTRYGYDRAHEATGGELRFELVVDSASAELHGLAWERLRDGSDRPPIATSERTPFYRRVGNARPRLAEPPLEVLVAICSPRALGRPGNRLLERLPPLDVAGEAAVLEAALRPLKEKGVVDYEILGADPARPVRFAELSDALQSKAQVLHLLAHGLFVEASYAVAIEREEGAQPLVPARELAEALLASQTGLRLVVLEACRSGEVARDEVTGAALGTTLVRSGVPAVVSMRENLGLRTARYFNQRFYFHLARSEHVEMALAATRFNIYQRKVDGERSWSVPVLHLGVTTGRLFGTDPARAPRLDDAEPELPPATEPRAASALGAVAEAVREAGEGGALDDAGVRRVSAAAVQAAAEAQPLARPQNRSEMSTRMPKAVRLSGRALVADVRARARLDLPPIVLDQVASALNAGKHLVLIGPPGTGKTSLAHAIAEHAAEERFSTGTIPTTASADWTTFDTVGGYVPETGDRLAFRQGIFLRAIATGRWLVLDELNRAEIDKAVGELFTVLSGQRVDLPYRVQGQPVRILPARRQPHPRNWVPDEATGQYDYVVHPNWRIVATMNVYDKSSLFSMSFAFMRRFAFVDVGVPDEGRIFRKLRRGWIDDRWREATGTQGNGSEAERAALDALDGKLAEVFARGDGALMGRRELGPAIAEDMIRYVFDRFRQDPAAALVDLAREAFLLYAVPQLDGLDRRAVLDVYGFLARLFYPETLDQQAAAAGGLPAREVLDRVASLYPHIRPEEWEDALRAGTARRGAG